MSANRRNARVLRSASWFAPQDIGGFIHRSALRAEGFSREAFEGRPVVGICNSWSELVNCNLHFRGLGEAVKRGVLQAGGIPLEFPTISLGENFMKPTTMLFRNLMAMDVEECIRAYPLDSVVLIAGCDKTVPAQLMGAASAGVPAIMLTGGPAEPGIYRGREIGVGTDLWRQADDLRAGRITAADFEEFEAAMTPSVGHCNELGSASTMAAIVEALGLALPGTAAIPAVDARRSVAAELTGRRAVALARERLTPDAILTAEAFDNAITTLMALGGSTNAVIHLLALAGRVGVPLTLERFDEIGRRTPVLANLRPSGEYLFEDFFYAGGVPALLKELAPLLHGETLTVTGRTISDEIADAQVTNSEVISPLDAPRTRDGGVAVLRGSLAPDGAILKLAAAAPHLFRHRGRAVVFEDVYDLAARVDDPALDVDDESVLVLKNAGPIGGPGMPEWGQLPIPQKLLRHGVTDLVRISDARMSGTAFGTVILHVAPEAAAGGPLAAVEDGDPIVLDVAERRLDLDVPAPELRRRLANTPAAPPKYRRGYGALFLEHVLQANEGCDFDFLRKLPDEEADPLPYGLLTGWVGGW
jgi:dihydroxy-acid dehydratase